MNEIFTQLIASAISPEKLPGLDYFDMSERPKGRFEIIINDGTSILVSVQVITNGEKTSKASAPNPTP